jgi:hypothetical protein
MSLRVVQRGTAGNRGSLRARRASVPRARQTVATYRARSRLCLDSDNDPLCSFGIRQIMLNVAG